MKMKRTCWWLSRFIVVSIGSLAAGQTSASFVPLLHNSFASSHNSGSNVSTPEFSEAATLQVGTAGSALPDTPSAVAAREAQQQQAVVTVERPAAQAPKAPANTKTVDSAFLIANGFLLGSTIANAEMIARCRPSACQSVPDAIRQRGQLYAIGISASLGVTYISYRLKKSGTGMWILPVALFGIGNAVYATHAAQFSAPSGAVPPAALHKR